MNVSETGTTPELIAQYAGLLSRCFPAAHHFDKDYLRWLYIENPDGPVVGFDAWDGESLAAHYVCIPAPIRVNGVARKALLSLNTATHPAYQGQGWFTRLAEHTYRAATEQGFDCVYGVANANSTPGFVRRLGFSLVGQLDAKVGIGRLTQRTAVEYYPGTSFHRVWNADSYAWRFRNPKNPVRTCTAQETTLLAGASARLPGLSAWAEVPVVPGFVPAGPPPGSSPRLFLGKLPAGQRGSGLFVDIPLKLRPSPLNLIFRNLTSDISTVEMAQVSLSFLDFDAY
jgi:GNAT superfamily N-acetyltransferase